MPADAAPPRRSISPEPFRSAEQAWLWTSQVLAMRRQGQRLSSDTSARQICAPEDVLHCLSLLYRAGKIDAVHAQVLRRWGDKGRAPKYQSGDRSDYRQWRVALDRLEEVLRDRKIVVGFNFEAQDRTNIRQPKIRREKNNPAPTIISLTRKSTSSSIHLEANRVGSLITDRAASVSWPCTTKLLSLAVISPPNPDQLRVAPSGATLSFLVSSRNIPTFNKEI